MAIQCLGNCANCKYLEDGSVDAVVCPTRVNMEYLKRLDLKIDILSSLLKELNEKVKEIEIPVKEKQIITTEIVEIS